MRLEAWPGNEVSGRCPTSYWCCTIGDVKCWSTGNSNTDEPALLQFCRVTCMLRGISIETIPQVTSLGTRPSACEGLVPRLPSYIACMLAWTSGRTKPRGYMHACLYGPVAGRSPGVTCMHAWMDQWQDEAQGLHACMLVWTSGRTKPRDYMHACMDQWQDEAQELHACLDGPVAR